MADAAKPPFGAIAVRAFSDRRLGELHFRVLGMIASHDRMSLVTGRGQGCTVPSSGIAAEIGGFNGSNVSTAINELAEWGYVQVEKRPKDRRQRVYRIIYLAADNLPGGQTTFEDILCPEGKASAEIVCPADTSKPSNRAENPGQDIRQSLRGYSAKRSRARGAANRDEPLDNLPVSAELWAEFRQHRRNAKATLTSQSETRIIAKLRKLQGEGHDPAAVLEQSIDNGWKGVFPIKADNGGRGGDSRNGLFDAASE